MSKVFLITGASSGIGARSAELLLSKGYTVYGAARRAERLETLTDRGMHPLAMDVTREEQLRSGIDAIISSHGRIDGLVNNAGYGEYGSLEDTPLHHST